MNDRRHGRVQYQGLEHTLFPGPVMKNRSKKQSERDTERFHEAIIAFAFAMKSADRAWIARTGLMTDRMKCAWEVYREWCRENPEKE